MNNNQYPQSFDSQSNTSLEESLQRLANQLNETPRRKVSLAFLYSWFFGNKDVLIGLLCFVFFAIPAIFLLLAATMGVSSENTLDFIWIIGCLVFGILGLVLFYPFCKAVFYLKNGYFTLAYLTQQGLRYIDQNGTEHYWSIPKRHFHQPLMTFLHNPNEPYLIAVGSNPQKIMVFDAQSIPETNDYIGFSIYMEVFAIPVLYDKRTKTFFTVAPKMWRLIIPIGIILWTTLWFFVSFFPAE